MTTAASIAAQMPLAARRQEAAEKRSQERKEQRENEPKTTVKLTATYRELVEPGKYREVAPGTEVQVPESEFKRLQALGMVDPDSIKDAEVFAVSSDEYVQQTRDQQEALQSRGATSVTVDKVPPQAPAPKAAAQERADAAEAERKAAETKASSAARQNEQQQKK